MAFQARVYLQRPHETSSTPIGKVLVEILPPGSPLILPSADMIGVIDTAREDELVKRAASAFEPGQNAAAGGLKELELNGPAGLLLADGRAGPNPTAPYKGPHLDLHQRTPRPVHISSRV